jgi:PPOX class probable F420-dependent enzyme
MLSLAQRRFLDARQVAHLATADARGIPHVVPVCFAIADRTLYVTIDEKPKRRASRPLKRLRNIAENPAVAVVADRYDDDWTRLGWVMLQGKAQLLSSGGAEHARAQALLRRRYRQLNAMHIESLPVIAVRVEDVISWGDLSLGQLAAVADSVNHQAGGAREDTNESWADNLSDRLFHTTARSGD